MATPIKMPTIQVIQKIRKALISHTKQKTKYVSHFKNGGNVADFKPNYKSGTFVRSI